MPKAEKSSYVLSLIKVAWGATLIHAVKPRSGPLTKTICDDALRAASDLRTLGLALRSAIHVLFWGGVVSVEWV